MLKQKRTRLEKILRMIPGYDPWRGADAFWIDWDEVELRIDFFHEVLTHVEGDLAGKPFMLEPWEQAIVGNLFGWKMRDDYDRIVRRYREAFIYVPRKNGKSPLTAGICNAVLFMDHEIGAQIYGAASARDQAALLFRQAKGQVENDPDLRSMARIYKGSGHKSIEHIEEHSVYRIIASDADVTHGGNSSLVIVDELHAVKKREFVDVLQTSLASANRAQPLMICLTTADIMRESICNEKYKYACDVRDDPTRDPAFLPVIYEARPEDDWKDEKVWAKANPNLGISVSLAYLRRECQRAQQIPAYQNTFKRLHLNIQTQQESRWLSMELWKECGTDGDPVEWRTAMLEELKGAECYGGLDLGSTADLTALSLVFRRGDELIILPWYWVPAESAARREDRDQVPYLTWGRQGFITMTDGNTTDYPIVRRDINALADRFGIRDLAVDRLFQGAQLCTELSGDGLNVIAFGQGFYSMAAPTKRFEELLLESKFRHGNNPVLTWQVGNVTVEQDAAGNMKPSKAKSTERIDGVVASIMALGRMQANNVDHFVYEDRGILTL